ncbi:hypothetical protein F53441_9355 [Fusarium austroafricanum]|uniref:Uncharacterized protein n=1 Tax=Fusarium austroafricanum TaxID=2364996 RepID=A0A8H4KBX4_9HYPO|nr:hypothetical protein F53441_9355 [Fusarium austroafricanum]
MPITLGSGQIVNLSWFGDPETKESQNAARVSDDIRRAWPQSLYVEGVEQVLSESDGYYTLEDYIKEQRRVLPLEILASVLSCDEPFALPISKWNLRRTLHIFHMDRLLTFLSEGFDGGWDCESLIAEPSSIHWQIRYFRPSFELVHFDDEEYACLPVERQSAAVGQGSDLTRLEEKRARFEVLRIFGRSFDAWGETLHSIDKFVHVNLSDFEDESNVEKLMFDKSFTLSKDYFVALQLLRIIDEWVDEILPTIENLRDSTAMNLPIFYADDAKHNFDAAVKSMKLHGDKIQKRAQKKTEEIKSLRDGLFNATSLREATKAMALNQAIYVFTVITVLFTPISFLAASGSVERHNPSIQLRMEQLATQNK